MNFDIFNIADYPDESKVCCLISNEKLHIILKGSIQRQLSDEDRKYLEHCFSCFDMKSAKSIIDKLDPSTFQVDEGYFTTTVCITDYSKVIPSDHRLLDLLLKPRYSLYSSAYESPLVFYYDKINPYIVNIESYITASRLLRLSNLNISNEDIIEKICRDLENGSPDKKSSLNLHNGGYSILGLYIYYKIKEWK